MQASLHNNDIYDFRQHDRVWRRVNPRMAPYPDMPGQGDVAMPTASGQNLAAQEAALPGAVQDPCCMGSAAAELLAVLTGYIEEELEDQRMIAALTRTAPAWARQTLREMAAEEGSHAKRLAAVYYLITGTAYCPVPSAGCIQVDHWRAALRSRYHAEACSGLNYARTADDTTDVCLSALLRELSADEYRHAEQLLSMLERSLRCGN